MAGYFNDGNGVKNITDGYFYDGDVKYYKDVVTTKYWKEVTTGSKELEYACYYNYNMYIYAKVPLGSDMVQYYDGSNYAQVYNIADLKKNTLASSNYAAIEETVATGYMDLKYPRLTSGDLYIDTTVTETVEGTPEDYTYTTEETETIEVTADDEYDYKEYYPKKIKQIYKVINGEAKLIFNNE